MYHLSQYQIRHFFPWKEREAVNERRPLIASQIKYHTRHLAQQSPGSDPEVYAGTPLGASIVCFQEVLHEQLMDIMSDLNEGHSPNTNASPPWAYFGVGRDDGDTKGEYNPIIFPTAVFHLAASKTYWLSPTPHTPSKGWDAACIRILTTAMLRHRATNRAILACNTHLDHAGSESRSQSISVMLQAIQHFRDEYWNQIRNEPYRGHLELPVLLAGDFNSFTTDDAYLAMQNSGLMYDMREVIEPKDRYGDGITYTGFQDDEDDDERGRIDFIFLGPKSHSRSEPGTTPGEQAQASLTNDSWRVLGYSVLPNFYNGIYCSDHTAIVGDVQLC